MGLVDLGASVGAFGRLLWRSLAASVLLGVMLLGAVVGYTARPLVDLFRDHPSSFEKPVEVVGEGITDGSDAAVKVIGTIWNFVLEAFWLLYDFEPFSEQNSELGLCLGPFAC